MKLVRNLWVAFAFSSFLTVALWAAPSKSAEVSNKIYGAVETKEGFLGGRLFDVLDSVGGSGTWMEWDVNGVRDPSLAKLLIRF